MPHNENSRVKIPALVHFTRLGYKYISLRKYEGVIDDDTNILVDVLCDAINRINATSLTTTDVQKIVNALKAMLENDDLGREFYSVLINGYNGLKLIDFEDFGGTVNSYHVVTEMTCKNGSDEFRPDITPLINGIPLAFIEVKKPNNKGGIKAEYDRMLMRIKNKKFRRFINLTQIMVFSNNSEYDDTEAVPLEGAFYSTISYEKLFFSHFREEDEKLLTSVPEKDEAVENFILTDNNLSSIKYSPEYVTNSSPVSPTNRIITSLFSFERILTFLKYAIAYVERTDENGITHLEKHLMRYPQFFATKAIENKLNAGVKNGIIWHTQGSGKTALAYYNVRYLTDYYQKHGTIAKFYFIVDRLDLLTQAANEFRARGLHVEETNSKEDFIKNIHSTGTVNNTGKPTITVVNIQKFSKESIAKQSDYAVNVQRIYFLDEAHRSYKPTGSFLANLLSSDREAVMIALNIIWKSLFKNEPTGNVPFETIQGLFGELYFMKKYMFEKHGIPASVRAWSGPETLSKDYAIGREWYEVKTAGANSSYIHISSVAQLSSDVPGHLAVIRVERMASEFSNGESSILELFESILQSISDEAIENIFSSKVASYGITISDSAFSTKFDVKDLKVYCVTDGFPRITINEIPYPEISNISYDISIAAIKRFAEE